MSRVFKWVIALCLVGGIGWVAFKWYEAQATSVEAFRLIPADAIYAISTDDPIGSWKQISGSGVWHHLHGNAYFAALTASANSLDSLVHENELLFNLIGSRALIVSAHMTDVKKYDFLFLVDLKEVAGIKFLNDYLTEFTAEGYQIRKEKHGKDDVIILHDPKDQSDLYLSLPGTNLLVSFSKKIITAALDNQEEPTGTHTERRQTVAKLQADLGKNGVMQLFLNYAMLPAFMSCYSDGANDYADRLSQTLQLTGLTLNMEGDLIKASGDTYLVDSIESYVKSLSMSGKGPTEILEIAPLRTGFYVGFGFTSFKDFFSNFEKNLKQDVKEYDSYKSNMKEVEDYLKISIQENVINWIGEEIAIFELQSSGKGSDSEAALVLKANNIEKARKDLAYIEKMVRRRTPVKFKAIDHRGYTINYLSMKGLFKVLLGKLFARYDKPYYTIINNFVIFSNHPQTLESIIDDYLDKKTLNRSAAFKSFRKEFDDEGCAFVYLNTPVLFNSLKNLADAPTRASMETNKEFIVCFRQIGFQLVPEAYKFKTYFAEQFVAPEPPATNVANTPYESDSIAEDPVVDPAAETDPMELPYIYAQDLGAASYSDYFPDSTVHFKVDLKNGFKDGSFTEYYPNGEEKMTGHFKKDKREGIWKRFDEEGKLTLRRRYDNDEVKKEKVKD